jgi:hypothetical protein
LAGWLGIGSVGGDGVAAPLAEVFDAVHALVDGRVDAEGGPDALPARRVATAGRGVHALALRRDRLGAPAAVVAARPLPLRLLGRRHLLIISVSSAVPCNQQISSPISHELGCSITRKQEDIDYTYLCFGHGSGGGGACCRIRRGEEEPRVGRRRLPTTAPGFFLSPSPFDFATLARVCLLRLASGL